MTWIVKIFLVILMVLFLWRVEKGAEACTCLNMTPLREICRETDVVIRAYILGKEEVNSGTVRSTKYNINPIRVFKGPRINAIYTSGQCKVSLDNAIGKDYLLTGNLDHGGVAHIIICDFKKPWNDVTNSELTLIENLDQNC